MRLILILAAYVTMIANAYAHNIEWVVVMATILIGYGLDNVTNAIARSR